jgi:3-isopropylmalate dehydratase small subunit
MSGRIFLLGDDIDTDQLAPGQFMKGGLDMLAAHCLESARPDFAGSVKPGDVIVAGKNFGMGSSREQAAEALKHLGLAGVVARSFAGIFYRNALNLGLPVLVADDHHAGWTTAMPRASIPLRVNSNSQPRTILSGSSRCRTISSRCSPMAGWCRT